MKTSFMLVFPFLFLSVLQVKGEGIPSIHSTTALLDTFRMCELDTTTATEGILYDLGGADAPHANNENCSFLINPFVPGKLPWFSNHFNSLIMMLSSMFTTGWMNPENYCWKPLAIGFPIR